jgi:beta-lactamase class A
MHSQRVQLRLLPLFALAAFVSSGLVPENRNGRVPPQAAGAATSMTDQIASIVNGFRGQMGVAAIDLRTGETIAIGADARFPTASTIKTAVMVEAWQQAVDGRLPMDTRIALRDGDKVGGSGILRGMAEGLSPSVADLVHLMIVLSDNTATNMLIERLGTARVNARLESYGLANTKLFRPTFRDGRPDVLPELEREFGLGMSTPRETARLMASIAEGKAVSRQASDAMLATLRRQQDRAMIPRLIQNEVGHRRREARRRRRGKTPCPRRRGHRHGHKHQLRDRDLRPADRRHAVDGGQRRPRHGREGVAHGFRSLFRASLMPCRSYETRERSGSEQRALDAFVIEQPALAMEAAAVARQAPVAADDAVAGKHDRDRVGAVRRSHRAHGGR